MGVRTVARDVLLCFSLPCDRLTFSTGTRPPSNAVDVYNTATVAWSTAQLSVARGELAAASVGGVALFAGGQAPGECWGWEGGGVDRHNGCILQRFSCDCWLSLTLATADASTIFDAVDVYNSATGAWSTAQLSVGRYALAAASVGNVALFAGGSTSSAFSCRVGGLKPDGCVS